MARKRKPCVIPDAVYPGMYRVQWSDGSLSDMLNKTRAYALLRGEQ